MSKLALPLGLSLFGLGLSACAHTKPEATTLSWVASADAVDRSEVLTPADIVATAAVNDVEISPDGARVAYVLRVPRPLDDPGRGRNQIWMVDADGRHEPTRFSPEARSSWSPRWSPDGKQIAFLSSRPGDDGHVQLYAMASAGGEAEPLMKAETSVGHFAWSPDGTRIAYSTTRPTETEESETEAGRDWVVDEAGGTKARLFVLDLETRESTEVVTSGEHVLDFRWGPKGERLAVRASQRASIDHAMMYAALYTVPASGGALTPLTETAGKLGDMAWSPDGQSIAFLGATDIHDSTAGTLYLVPSAGGEAKALTAGFEATATRLSWTDDRSIVFLATQGTATTLNKVPRGGGPVQALSTVNDAGALCRDLSIAPRGALACSASAPTHPREVYVGKLGGRKLQRRTLSNPHLRERKLGEQLVVDWKASDGLELQGVVIKPVGFVEGTAYPLAVLPHGGPEGTSLHAWTTGMNSPAQLFATRGYVVFMPNYRGSAGRGPAFAKADHNDLGGEEFNDVLAGIDSLAARGWVDPERVGMGGWSYGGYFSGLAATMHSDRFRAAMVAAAITNWVSFTGTTEIEHENSLVHWNMWPWDDMDLPWERSPLAHMKGSKTATLIVHGAADTRVPVGQSLELYRGLLHLGTPTQLVMYPREGHGLGENVHGLDFMNRFVDWFDTYVKAQ